MTKLEFTRRMNEMKIPALEFNSHYEWPFLSQYAVVTDEETNLHFCGPMVKMSRSEYLSKSHDGYYGREANMIKKYTKWFNELILKEKLGV